MRLSTREIAVVSVGVIAVLFMGSWLWIVEPVGENLSLLDRKLSYQMDRMDDMEQLSTSFTRLEDQISATEARLKRGEDFSILSHLEGQAKQSNVKRHIVQMKPLSGQSTRFYRENMVEIKMEKVPLDQLVRYLYKVENSPELLRIKELRIKPRFDNKNLMDARFKVSAYELMDS
jgi:general secretion pathway protein M